MENAVENNIEIYSDEVQELMEAPPALIIRYGITGILVSILVLIALTFFIDDNRDVAVTITALPGTVPATITTAAKYKIIQPTVLENQLVHKNQVLALTDNDTLNYASVISIKNYTHLLDSALGIDKVSFAKLPVMFGLRQLGGMQQPFFNLRWHVIQAKYEADRSPGSYYKHLATLEKAVDEFKRNLTDWESTHVVKSPIKGLVSIGRFFTAANGNTGFRLTISPDDRVQKAGFDSLLLTTAVPLPYGKVISFKLIDTAKSAPATLLQGMLLPSNNTGKNFRAYLKMSKPLDAQTAAMLTDNLGPNAVVTVRKGSLGEKIFREVINLNNK
ncbi:HlyD family secretion protein [Mucilaginibacter pedocola]|uniref:Uncharacterized protein n=1 Tax=Mucilaginibacter pedocola TaxID=1792845 RepID=A0A1S9P723_9SPHI|nr:hypothetical protein [Mucilaginibacter pedocola]OOQ56753.1 hypothetical protein BC343_17335 [Mucilaginibacter pedocola]